jgi:hypothetical protein
MKYTLNILLSTAFAVMLLFTASCSKKVAPDVPTARSSALFEIFRLMDSRQYRAALPLVEKYQSMEPTNEFLSELKQIVCTNIAIQEAEAFAQKGKLKEACEHLDKCIRDYGELPGIVAAKKVYLELQEILILLLSIQSFVLIKYPDTHSPKILFSLCLIEIVEFFFHHTPNSCRT